ncbi:MAG TPA: hypothetical protein VLF20_05390 [Patescibacteria group bacterium]|nr:hypothetical protein [Patescibacteria group bacterium]
MDQNQTVPSTPQQPVPQTPVVQKKSHLLGLVILLLFIIASIVTAVVYFLLPQKEPSTSTTPGTSSVIQPTPQPKDTTPWTTYTDRQYGYLFHYPQTWKLENDKTNPEKFVLRMSGNKPGEIQGEFMSREQFSKEADPACGFLSVKGQPICFIKEKTASSAAYVYPTMDSNNEVTLVTAYITRPEGAGLTLKVTKPNEISYDVFLGIMDTLQFPNEKRITPLLICPESWSTDKKTVSYRGITFAASDIDKAWIQENCK